MVCVRAYAPTHTIFVLIFYRDLSRYKIYLIRGGLDMPVGKHSALLNHRYIITFSQAIAR